MNENCENTNERVFKILIVEDEKEILDALKLALTNAWEFNSEISTTENCETALTEIEQQNYDLVLAAHRMSGMDGLELFNKISKDYPEISRILITDYPDLEQAKNAVEAAKVDNYIKKPIYHEELKSKVYGTLMQRTDPKFTDVNKVDTVEEGLSIVEDSLEQLRHAIIENDRVQAVTLEFNSPTEFKAFTSNIKLMTNVYIEDLQTLGDKFIITVGLFVEAFDKII